MADLPVTSISMLKAISSGTDNARWTEFFRKYEQPMRGFLHERFPSVEPEDAMQETLIALMKALPDYHYTPDVKGHFRNYLMGILRNKAADILKKRASETRKRSSFAAESETDRHRHEALSSPCPFVDDEAAFRESIMETAVDQLMSDPRISPTTREVFRHVALMHEPPETVAAAFGLTRNNVDQIKKRMIDRLAHMVHMMTLDLNAI